MNLNVICSGKRAECRGDEIEIMNPINLQQIFVTNIAGIVVLLVLLQSRRQDKRGRHLGDQMFQAMIGISLSALIVEILVFVLDGKSGFGIHILLVVANSYLFFAAACVGVLWVFYVDYRIYRSRQLLRKMMIPMLAPFFMFLGILLIDALCNTGNIFYITEQNQYVRGKIAIISYVLVFFYYGYSIFLTTIEEKRRSDSHFFPVNYFIFPCVIGTIVQGLNYGITAGWFGVSLAFLFVQMQLHNLNAYVDELSGLFNRKYYAYFIEKIKKNRKNKSIYGIMMDVNGFKDINDLYGHTMGDDAIRSLGKILSGVAGENDIVVRLSGDEFVILCVNAEEKDVVSLIDNLEQRIESFNNFSGKPYHLSLAIGYTFCNSMEMDSDYFLRKMDQKMYQAKEKHYAKKGYHRRSLSE